VSTVTVWVDPATVVELAVVVGALDADVEVVVEPDSEPPHAAVPRARTAMTDRTRV